MARFAYPDPASLPEEIRQLAAPGSINVTRMMAGASPAVCKNFTAFVGALMSNSALSPQLREIAILRVGYLSNAGYEVWQHEALARHVGLTDAQIEAIREGSAAAGRLGEAGEAVLAFTDDLVRNVRASDASLAAVRAHLSDQQILDLIFAIGAYMLVSRLLETTGVDFEEAPVDWSKMAGAGRR